MFTLSALCGHVTPLSRMKMEEEEENQINTNICVALIKLHIRTHSIGNKKITFEGEKNEVTKNSFVVLITA